MHDSLKMCFIFIIANLLSVFAQCVSVKSKTERQRIQYFNRICIAVNRSLVKTSDMK